MKEKLGIIGGRGKMGQWLYEQLKDSFQEVLLYDLNSELSFEAFVPLCDVIAISVPISKTESVLKELKKLLKKDQCVFDLTSLKEKPCQIMLSYPCSAFGMHPLFGPDAPNKTFKTLVFCEVRPSLWDKWFKELWSKKGYCIHEMGFKEHDQKMAWIQALNPLLQLSLGASLKSDFSKELSILTTPTFSLFFESLQRFTKQDPKLYFEMAAYNPYFTKVFEAFQNHCLEMAEAIQNKEESFFRATFDKLQSFLKEVHQ